MPRITHDHTARAGHDHPSVPSRAQLAPSRASETNPNHHLWKNGRLWWLAVTLLHDGWRQERIRQSLGTDDLLEARRRRDLVLARFARPGAGAPATSSAAASAREHSREAALLRRVDARLAVVGGGLHVVGALGAGS
jgi:hypothetical protein